MASCTIDYISTLVVHPRFCGILVISFSGHAHDGACSVDSGAVSAIAPFAGV